MFKQPSYFEEEKIDIKENKIVIFCIIIAIITVAIIVFTGVLVYQVVVENKNIDETEAMTGEKTTGIGNQKDPNVTQNSNTSENSNNTTEKSEVSNQENVSLPKQEFKFPEHDISMAMESQLPQYSENIAQKVIDVYFEETKKVYLTFDDGPSSNTSKILDILDEYGIKATFFVLGVNVDKNPETTKRIYDSGHFIASHGYSHVYKSIYASPENVLAEYNQSLDSIRGAIGVANYNPHLFRFPGGSSGGTYNDVKQQAIQLLRENEITYTNWNCLTGDSAGSDTIEKMWDELNETAIGDDNLVVLMHDAADKELTVEFLPQFIEKYQSEGYEFCTYYDVMKE